MGKGESLEQQGPALEMSERVLNPGDDNFLETVLPEVLVGEDAEGLVEGVALAGPEQFEVAETLHHVLELCAGPLELPFRDGQFPQHLPLESEVAPDEAEDSLSKLFDQILAVIFPPVLEIGLFLRFVVRLRG